MADYDQDSAELRDAAPPTAEMFAQAIMDSDFFTEVDATPVSPIGSGNYVASFTADLGGPFEYQVIVKRLRKGQLT